MTAERDPIRVVGQTIADKYLVESLVGEGGFALVYRAIHAIWKKPVAIKFFSGLSSAPLEQRESLMQDFIQEGALLTELSSETANIVQARDVGTFTSVDGQWMPYMVLEWLQGMPLDVVLETERRLDAGRWSLVQIMRLLGPAVAALQVAHRRGVAHRDIKPANLFVLGSDARSGNATVKLLDFGVAKLMADNTHMQAALAKTGTTITSFTPQYGAPEQFSRTYGATGPWTDVFSLALIMVEMLVGTPALDGQDVVQLAVSAGNPEKRPTPSSFGVELSQAIDAVFVRALAPFPSARYPNAAEFWSALEAAVAELDRSETLPVPSHVLATALAAATGPRDGLATSQSLLPSATPTTAKSASLSTERPKTLKRGFILASGLALSALGLGAFFFTRPPGTAASLSAAAPASARHAVLAVASALAVPSCPSDTVLIPAGQFFMGSDQSDALANEKPSHNVSLNAFCMDLYEVTAGQYKTCSEIGKCRRATGDVDWPGIKDKEREVYAKLCTVTDPNRADHPANCLSFSMADTYCKAQDKRLPTEAEWEYATRGPDGRVYPWGDEPPTARHLNACGTECVKWGRQNKQSLVALYETDDGYATTAPVGKFPEGKSRFGPYDVAGNVWEWVSDWYGDYEGIDKKNPVGPATGEKRVIRGGAWNGSFASWLRPSFRYAQDPAAKSHGIGFRCAKSLGD